MPDKSFWDKAREFLWGLFYMDMYHETKDQARRVNDLINLMIFGELVGVPLMSANVTLRLLPYTLRDLPGWKERTLQEHDITEELPHID